MEKEYYTLICNQRNHGLTVEYMWRVNNVGVTNELQKSLFTLAAYLFFYTLICVLNTQIRYKQLAIAHLAIIAKDALTWISIVMPP